MPTELTGDALLDYYREALAACYGRAVATKSDLRYDRGWYYVGRLSRIFNTARRAAQVREMADELYKQARRANARTADEDAKSAEADAH